MNTLHTAGNDVSTLLHVDLTFVMKYSIYQPILFYPSVFVLSTIYTTHIQLSVILPTNSPGKYAQTSVQYIAAVLLSFGYLT